MDQRRARIIEDWAQVHDHHSESEGRTGEKEDVKRSAVWNTVIGLMTLNPYSPAGGDCATCHLCTVLNNNPTKAADDR